MSAPEHEATVMRAHVEQLGARVQRLLSFGSLRRSLRVAEEDQQIASAAQRFAVDVVGCTHFAIYGAETDDSDFQLLSSTPQPNDLPSVIERGHRLAEDLDKHVVVRGADLVVSFQPKPKGDLALALRASQGRLIGIVLLGGSHLDGELLEELLDELIFDVESALAARIITRLRAEELAVLEIQERELVGLLRDVEARDEIIQRDLEEARQFQRKMWGAPPRVDGATIEVVYKPLGLVGGDLYAVSVERNRLRLFVADATGHGVRASLTTMFIKSGYEAVRLQAPEPAALLAALNDTIAQTYKSSEMLFSAVCVDIDLTTGRLCSSAAAHPPICLVRSGETSFVEGAGAFLGLRRGMKFTTHETSLSAGDGVYLFTDGFSEARKQNVQFGDDRLRAAVAAAHQNGTPAGQAVVDAVTNFLDGTPMDDDGTFVGVRFRFDADAEPSSR